MKCRACQHELLTAATPELPAHAVADHLASCAVCREWHRRLLRIESNVERIPVPASEVKERFLERLTNPVDPPAPLPILPLPPPRRPLFGLATAGLVAAVILIACGIFLGNLLSRSLQREGPAPVVKAPEKPPEKVTPKQPTPKDKTPAPVDKAPAAPPATPPLASRLLTHDLSLAEADTPRRRVETLAALADELQGETRALARKADPEDLHTLARLYVKVIREGIMARARQLPMDERRQILEPMAKRLDQTRRDVQELAREVRPASAEALRQIAMAAQDGTDRLRVLMEEATP
jgi:hypothetical protein